MNTDKGRGIRKDRYVFVGVVLIYLCLGFVTSMFKGFIDFPCFVYFNEESQCFETDDYVISEGYNDKIQVFLDTSLVGYSGLGCHMDGSEGNTLEMKNPAIDMRFEIVDDDLVLNGVHLPAGEDFSYTNFVTLNPWTVYTMRLTNFGVGSFCGSDAPSRFIVIGEYGNKIATWKALVILSVLLIGVQFVIAQLKKK